MPHYSLNLQFPNRNSKFLWIVKISVFASGEAKKTSSITMPNPFHFLRPVMSSENENFEVCEVNSVDGTSFYERRGE
jgi:hypothetical protein